MTGTIIQLVTGGVALLREQFVDRVPDDALAAVERLAPRWMDVLVACAEGPHTVTHNDCRLDNIFFARGGSSVFVDWSLVARTRGTQDVANLLAGSMEIVDLRASWETLVTRYHRGLEAHGVVGYGLDQCIEHYRQSIVYPIAQGLALLGALNTGDDRGVSDAAMLRPLLHCADLDAFSTVR